MKFPLEFYGELIGLRILGIDSIILIPLLPNESKEVLYENGIIISTPTSNIKCLITQIYQFITLMTILGSVFNSKVMKIGKVGFIS